MSGPWVFRVDMPTPSLNEIQGQHWSTVSKKKEAMGWLLVSALNKCPQIPLAASRRRLTIVRHGKGRLDNDNLCGGVKGLVDAIKMRKLILDDNPDVCELIVHQVVDRKAVPHTMVMIEDLPIDGG